MKKEPDRYQKGKATRTKVLGAEYVRSSIKAAGEFEEPFQQIAALGYTWGDIWSRPGLDLKTRSICTVAVLASLGRLHHLRIHIKGALRNGVTKEELREVFLHISVYAGMPAAGDGFRVAQEVFDEYYAGEKSKSSR